MIHTETIGAARVRAVSEVLSLWVDLLGEPINPDSITEYLAEHLAGTDRQSIARMILTSTEYRQRLATKIAAHFLARGACPLGSRADCPCHSLVDQLGGGDSEQEAIATALTFSQASYKPVPEPSTPVPWEEEAKAYLVQCYRLLFGESYEAPAPDADTARFMAGMSSHHEVTCALLGSAEYRSRRVTALYGQLLNRL